ncbi:MAG: CPBP family intramembrane metalloprotease [Bacteroidetes bacterium]|nr:CPBP family intramembrane metalloprotease [Bacteroidota bacterium]
MSKKGIIQKILHFPLTKIIVGIIVVAGVYVLFNMALVQIFKTDVLTEDVISLVIALISTILSVITYVLLFKFYEKREIKELSTNGLAKNLSVGLLLGFVLQSLTILVIFFNGGYSIISVNPIVFIIPPFAMAFSSAIFEEILFRGIIFRVMEEKLGSYVSLIISAVIFGLLHMSNPNSSFIAGVGLAIQAGLLLAAAYIFTRNLWFPIAIHFAWNFTQSAIFGANVSGITLSKTLITSKISGVDWITGGPFGPEGSIQATSFCLMAAIILLILNHKQGKIIKPYWKK